MTTPTAPNPPVRYLPIRYLLVLWLLVISAVAFLDRTNISIAGLQIGTEFGIDHTRLGWVFSAFLVGYAALQIPGGMLARRFGPRRVLAFSVVWWGVFTAMTAMVSPSVPFTLVLLIAIRFALGAGEAVMYPAASQFVERWFPCAERGKANGIIFGGVGIGAGLTPPLLTAVILRYGWRTSFWLCAVVGLVTGVVWYLAARDTPDQLSLVSPRELEHIAAGRDPIQEKTPPSAAPSNTCTGARIWVRKEVVALSLSYFTFGYVAWIFFSWFYFYLAQVRGMYLKASAVYTMRPFIAMTLGSLLGGASSDWLAGAIGARTGRCLLPACALASTSVLLLVGSRSQCAQTTSLVLASGAGALYVSQSCYWSVAPDIAGKHAGLIGGIMNMGGQIGGAVTASLTPLIAAHFGWGASFFIASALAAMGALAWLAVNPEARLVAVGSSRPTQVT